MENLAQKPKDIETFLFVEKNLYPIEEIEMRIKSYAKNFDDTEDYVINDLRTIRRNLFELTTSGVLYTCIYIYSYIETWVNKNEYPPYETLIIIEKIFEEFPIATLAIIKEPSQKERIYSFFLKIYKFSDLITEQFSCMINVIMETETLTQKFKSIRNIRTFTLMLSGIIFTVSDKITHYKSHVLTFFPIKIDFIINDNDYGDVRSVERKMTIKKGVEVFIKGGSNSSALQWLNRTIEDIKKKGMTEERLDYFLNNLVCSCYYLKCNYSDYETRYNSVDEPLFRQMLIDILEIIAFPVNNQYMKSVKVHRKVYLNYFIQISNLCNFLAAEDFVYSSFYSKLNIKINFWYMVFLNCQSSLDSTYIPTVVSTVIKKHVCSPEYFAKEVVPDEFNHYKVLFHLQNSIGTRTLAYEDHLKTVTGSDVFCFICSTNLAKKTDKLTAILPCKHVFCLKCIRNHFYNLNSSCTKNFKNKIKNSCPNCQSYAEFFIRGSNYDWLKSNHIVELSYDEYADENDV